MRPIDTALSHFRPQYAKCRGFNLVEAAIVLGVVGLVIGGIWVAASAINTEIKTRQVYQGILNAAEIMRQILTQRAIQLDPYYDQYGRIRVFLGGKLEGFDLTGTDFYGLQALGTPFGGTSYFAFRRTSNPTIWPNFNPIGLVVRIPSAACYRLLKRFRALILQDTSGNYIAGLSTGRGSTGSYLGYYLPGIYNNNSNRFDNEDVMCGSDSSIIMMIFITPLPN